MVSRHPSTVLLLCLLLWFLVCPFITNGFYLERIARRSHQLHDHQSLTFARRSASSNVNTRRKAASDHDNNNGDNNNNDSTPRAIGTARFRGAIVERVNSSDDLTSRIDTILAWFNSDVASIGLGMFGLVVVLLHRFMLPDMDSNVVLLGEETRADLLAAVACGAVLVNGVSQLDVTSALSESVELDGMQQSQVLYPNDDKMNQKDDDPTKANIYDEIEWALKSALTATPAKTVVLLECLEAEQDDKILQWKIKAMVGIIPRNSLLQQAPTTATPILDRLARQADDSEAYLPTLPVLPGRFEFTYLPSNTQLVLMLPIRTAAKRFVLVLGSNRSKSFAPRDIVWSQILAARMGTILSSSAALTGSSPIKMTRSS